MLGRCLPVWLALAALGLTAVGAHAFDDAQFPNFKGQWERTGSPRWDTDRSNKNAPLTPEYRAIYQANVADMEAGGQGDDPTYMCMAPGMPRDMVAYENMEVVVAPDTTYILIDHIHDSRRIFTDGRDWPDQIEPTFTGYSIGRWVDTKGDGHFDLLEVETRGFKGPRVFDESGLPLHHDNQTIVKERIFFDRSDPNLFYDEITTFDHALTRPWTITKSYRRVADKHPVWREIVCMEDNQHVRIGKDDYFLSADGRLMPARKDQPPPDLTYFKTPAKPR
jgi:hypothetical protein